MSKAKIIGTGMYAPGDAIDNQELMKLANVEFDADKIAGKIGIKARHIAHLRGIDETTLDFSTKAAEAAIADAGIKPEDVNLFVLGTDTPEFVTPAGAIMVQGRIQGGERFGGAFDVSASCASFTTALNAASAMVAADESVKYAVVIGCYNMPQYVREGDSFGYSIFADGAGAVVLERTDDADESGYMAGQHVVDGTQWDYIGVYAGGTRRPVTKEVLDEGKFGLELVKPLPGDRNVKLWPPIARMLAEKAGVKVDDIDQFIFTQINSSVIDAVMDELGQPKDQAVKIMDRYGYTGSGCVPMALHVAREEGTIKKGDLVMCIASGAGFAVCGNVFKM